MPESGPLIFFDSGHYKGSHRGEITCHIKHVYILTLTTFVANYVQPTLVNKPRIV